MPVIEISSLTHPGVEIFSTLTEAQLRNRIDPQRGIFIAESPKVIRVALEAGYEPVSLLCERKHLTGDAADIVQRMAHLPIYTGDRELLARLTGYTLTRGVLCAMRRLAPRPVEEVCRGARRVVVIHGVVDTTNIGAIFRSAAALNMDAVLITPSCCDPLCRRAVRVSMGTVFQVPWAYVPEDWPALLRAQGKEAKSADPAARAMSWMKTEAMLAMKPGDATTADLISTGCSMGIKSLARYCNQYPTASREAKDIAQSLIRLEDQLVKDMRPYL